MKTIRKTFATVSLSLSLGLPFLFHACNFLDIDPYITDLFTLDSLFIRKEYTRQYLNNVYSYLPNYGSPRDYNGTPYILISDEGVSTYGRIALPYYQFINDKITPDNFSDTGYDRWDSYYEGIRKANTFIMMVNKCEEAGELKRSEWIGEATFIKACLYFELMLAWGPIPIMPDKPVDFDTPIGEMLTERNTWDECSDYVASLLETAIQLLPEQIIDNAEIGRPTKSSAMAVLSRLTLYTASPLFNGDNKEFELNFKNNAGVPYLNPVQSSEKWAVAAANARRLVDLKPNDLYTVPKMDNTPRFPVPENEQADFPNGVGGIDPYHSYADMFNGECMQISSNKEILFSRRDSKSFYDWRYSTSRFSSPAMIGGWGSFNIPQELVDAYYMMDGKTVDNASSEYPYEYGYTDNETVFSGSKSSNGFTILSGTHKWYVNREMRFYATVAYNNSYYPSVSTPPDKIDLVDGKTAKYFLESVSGKHNLGGVDYYKEEYPMTGYLCRKFTHYEDSWQPGGRTRAKYFVMYRMAEVYLNYVEAMNELDKSYTINGVTVSRDVNEMKRCFNLIRYRAGLPGITDADVADVARMRELILRERQIEMAWESRRYFDLRRTKQAMKYENKPLKGMNINASEADPDDFYQVIEVKEANWMYQVFTNRRTFFPIPRHEIDKNINLDQFPGY